MPKASEGGLHLTLRDSVICFALAFIYLLMRASPVDALAMGTDHNYQLSMAVAILHGKLPGIDFHIIYGPLVAFTSALAFYLGGYAGEAVVCAAGYAGAITVAATVLFRLNRRISGYLCALMLALVLSRFYKWYYWLFQVVPLVFFLWRMRPDATLRSLAAWGAVTGIAFFFRIDLGALGLAFGLLSMALWDQHIHGFNSYIRHGACFAAGFLAIVLLWSLFTIALSDIGHLVDFFSAFFIGSSQLVDSLRIAPFQFDFSAPLSRPNLLAVLQTAVLLIYAFGLWVGWRARRGQPFSIQDCTIGAIALLGLGVYPQAMHRADAAHFLQVVPPLIILLLLLCDFRQPWRSAASIITLGVLYYIGWPVASLDMGPLFSDKRALWAELYQPPERLTQAPIMAVGLAAARATSPEDGIFLAVSDFSGPIFVAANRRFAGIMPSYFPGLGSDPYWEKKIRASLQADPPKVIITVRSSWYDPAKATPLAPYYADVLADWRSRYTELLYENPRYIMLGLPKQN